VLERGLSDGRDYVAGDYSIADMAIFPWINPPRHGQTLDDFPKLAAWVDRVGARPGVVRGMAVGKDLGLDLAGGSKDDEQARRVMFGQRATA
jgi:glutathione S-transferase